MEHVFVWTLGDVVWLAALALLAVGFLVLWLIERVALWRRSKHGGGR